MSLLDIKNAFTSVPIHLLMRVMQKRGVPLEWLNMIFEASYNVDNSFYNPITMEYEHDKAYSGVKQGCPLSPLLFSIFIDPILSAIPGLKDHVICYINDIAVIHTTREGYLRHCGHQVVLGKAWPIAQSGQVECYGICAWLH